MIERLDIGESVLFLGDCLEVMPTLPADSIDAIVTDPPYGLGFMGKDWDHGVPGCPFWRAALRVAKPGAHLLAFGGTRTFHRLAAAMTKTPISETLKYIFPFVLAMLAVVILVAYVPQVALFVPNLVFGK